MKISREPKYNIGDEVKVISTNQFLPDYYAFVKGYEYYGEEFVEPDLTGYDYTIAYQLDDGTWEIERYSEDYIE